MAGVSNLDFYFLQHGITLHDISSWLQKYDRNPKLIVTCAESESESFKTDKYNYDENTIQTLGFPRFDNLNNDNVKKQIVIMPTWRRDLTDKDAFIKSEYFKHFNSLINNKRLIDFAQENGFEITTETGVNIEYVYAFTSPVAGSAYVVLRVDDEAGAEAVLAQNGIRTLSDEDMNGLL